MNTIQKITKNIGILSISQILSYILGFFVVLYSANYLGVDGFGSISLALALTGIFSVGMDLGLSMLSTRDVARDKSITLDYTANLITLKLILVILTFFLTVLIVHVLGYSNETIQIIYLITIYTIFTSFTQLIYALFQGHEKMEYQSIGNILSNLLLLIGVLIAIYLKLDIIKFSLVYPVTSILVLIYAFSTFSKKFAVPKLKVDRTKWISLVQESWPFAISIISVNLYLWIDSVILSVFDSAGSVGLYNASYKLIIMLLIIPSIFNITFFPIMSKYYMSSAESLKILFDKLIKLMFLISVPICVGTFLIADRIILLIYGEQFVGAIIILQILIWSIILSFVRSPLTILLESTNKQLSVTKIFILGAIFNIFLNLIIIPKYSYVGAAITNILTDLVLLTLLLVATRNIGLYVSKNTKISFIKIVLASLVMGTTINYLLNLNVFLLIIIGIILYTVILLILRIFDNKEIKIIKSISD